ncbi:hypothetical protein [Burkholderia cenocepacia]|nr:hypothetical protein [Burkholderia cenocepacia]
MTNANGQACRYRQPGRFAWRLVVGRTLAIMRIDGNRLAASRASG